jgi:hypothetical protein
MGTLSMLSLYSPAFLVPGALVGGLYYFLAGALHVTSAHRNFNENFAMVTDFLIAIVLLGFVGAVVAMSHGIDVVAR